MCSLGSLGAGSAVALSRRDARIAELQVRPKRLHNPAMTTDDLRMQKALAMLELEESETVANVAGNEYDRLAKAVDAASDAVNGRPVHYGNESDLRNALSPYADAVNVDAIVAALARKNATAVAVTAARVKLAVFRG